MRALGKSLEALRKAPVTEPFDGPAILSGRAAAVFLFLPTSVVARAIRTSRT